MCDDGFQNMFVYQATFSTLGLKKEEGYESMLFLGKQKFYLNLNFFYHGAFWSNVKRFGYKIRMQFNNTPLVVQQQN